MKRIIIVLVLLAFSAPIMATMPVYDPLAWIQRQLSYAEKLLTRINSTVNNNLAIVRIRNQINQLKRMERQWHQIERTYNALSGKHGYGRWLRGPAQLLDPKFKPKSRDEWIDTFGRGQNFQSASERALPPDPENARQQDDLKINTRKVKETGDITYDHINTLRQKIMTLMDNMDEAETLDDQVAIQTAMMAEMNMNMTLILQLLSTQSQLQSSVQQGNVNRNDAEARFNRY